METKKYFCFVSYNISWNNYQNAGFGMSEVTLYRRIKDFSDIVDVKHYIEDRALNNEGREIQVSIVSFQLLRIEGY